MLLKIAHKICIIFALEKEKKVFLFLLQITQINGER